MYKKLCASLVLALTFLCLPLRATAQQGTSQPEKAKKCEESAKKTGLKGDDRAAFLSTCMAAKDTAAATMSPEEKAKGRQRRLMRTTGNSEGPQGERQKGLYENLRGRQRCPQVVSADNKKRRGS